MTPDRIIRPLVLPEVPGDEIEFLTKVPLVCQVARTLAEREMEFGDPMVSEVMLAEGAHAGFALSFSLPDRRSIEITRYWWNRRAFFIVGRLGRNVMQTSIPILNEEADKEDGTIIKSEVGYVLDDLLSRGKI